MTTYERNKAIDYMLETDTHEWSIRRLKAWKKSNREMRPHKTSYCLFGIPDWVIFVHDHTNEWPKHWKPRLETLNKAANHMADKWKKRYSGCPLTQSEVDQYLRADTSYYESYPVFCASKERPEDWDYLHISDEAKDFSRCQGFMETRIGEWFLIVGFDHD